RACTVTVAALFLFSSPAPLPSLPSFPTRRSSDLLPHISNCLALGCIVTSKCNRFLRPFCDLVLRETHTPALDSFFHSSRSQNGRSEEHTSELQSRFDLVCRLLLEKKKKNNNHLKL